MAFKGLFIGIDRYDSPEINWLGCASRDAKALHGLFTDTPGGETTLLTDEQATVAAIRQCFEGLAACDPEDVVVIAFSIRAQTVQSEPSGVFSFQQLTSDPE